MRGLSRSIPRPSSRKTTSPTIGALQKRAIALERDLPYFRESEDLDEIGHQRAEERRWHEDPARRGHWNALTPRIPGSRLSAHFVELAPGGPQATATTGETDDVFLVRRGVVRFECTDTVPELGAGDSIHLRGGTSYRFVNPGPEKAALFQFSGYRRTMPAGFAWDQSVLGAPEQ